MSEKDKNNTTMEDLWLELRKTVQDESYLVTITLNKDYKGFGFNIRGGIDHPHVGCDTGIFVTAIRADSVAGEDGRLCQGDRILAVNNTRLDNVSHDEAVRAFRIAESTVSLLVEKGAEKRILENPGSSENSVGIEEVDAASQDSVSLHSAITSFFKSTVGALTLGVMAGSLTVFIGLRVYKAMAK